jgi:site-specific DNA recombinase
MKYNAAYCRSACEEPGSPSSAYGQAKAIREYAERRGLPVGAIYTDAGVSGVTLERPALQRLIADCRAGKIGTVITKDAARLSRDFSQLVALLHIFQTTGVRVEYSTREGEPDRFLATILSAVAELDEARSQAKANS